MRSRDDRAPDVLIWYRVYCALKAFLYFAFIIGGLLIFVFRAELVGEDVFDTEEEAMVVAVVPAGLGTLFTPVFLAALFFPARRWSWVYGVVIIAFGMTSVCCWPVCIPLLIFWCGLRTRDYFGWGEKDWPEPRRSRRRVDWDDDER